MPDGFRNYNSKEVKISIAGIPIEGGYGDGDFLRIERESPAFTDVVGSDGEVTRNYTNDDRATATIILMQGAQSNAVLSALHNSDKSSPNGSGVGKFLVEDLNGGTLHESPQCWIETEPDHTYGREAGPREWGVRLAKLKNTLSGYT